MVRFARELQALGPFKLLCWRSINVDFQRAYIHDWLYGKQVLKAIAWLEEKIPYILGRLGQYPMFVVQKSKHPIPGNANAPF